jgi:hypothetical protein
MAAADSHQARLAELGRQHCGLVRIHLEPIGDAVDRGPAKGFAARLLE